MHVASSASESELSSHTFGSVAALPLLLTLTRGGAYAHRLGRSGGEDGQWRLTLLDCLLPSAAPLLCLAANHRLSSAAYCEAACVDALGDVHLWLVHLSGGGEDGEGKEEGEDGEEGPEAEGAGPLYPSSFVPAPSLAASRRGVRSIPRSSYAASLDPSPRPLSFARCCFAPHPRSLVVALDAACTRLDLSYSEAEMGGGGLLFSSAPAVSPVPLPPLQSVSVPIHRSRDEVSRSPALLRDHFFPYQLYRTAARGRARRAQQPSSTSPADASEQQPQPLESEEEGEGGEEALRPETAFTDEVDVLGGGGGGRLKAEESKEVGAAASNDGGGRVWGLCAVAEWPQCLALLSSSHLQLLDLRYSQQPLLEWQLPRRVQGPCHVSALLLPPSRTAGQSLLLAVCSSDSGEVSLFHCSRPTSPSASLVAPFAPLRLPSFCHLQAQASTAFALLTQSAPALTGLALLFLQRRPQPSGAVCGGAGLRGPAPLGPGRCVVAAVARLRGRVGVRRRRCPGAGQWRERRGERCAVRGAVVRRRSPRVAAAVDRRAVRRGGPHSPLQRSAQRPQRSPGFRRFHRLRCRPPPPPLL